MTQDKKVIAVIFGSVSVEHDVSILTGLQIFEAIDSTQYTPIPIYIDQNGQWYIVDELLNRKNYHFSQNIKDRLHKISLKICSNHNLRPFFEIENNSFFKKKNKIFFDVAFLALHGGAGENGQIQGLLSMLNIPFTGTDHFTSSIFMNKSLTKKILKDHNISVLNDQIIKKPKSLSKKNILSEINLKFPLCVKPCNLGSSVAVSKVTNEDDLFEALLTIFQIDDMALIEPFVENLVEYNISITKCLSDKIELSAIEKPIKNDNLLCFKDKYLNDGNDFDNKLQSPFSQGMASSSREINPKLSKKNEKFIKDSAIKLMEIFNFNGAPRIDFLSDEKSDEIWFNEVNPLPGSLGYYLWENADNPTSFTRLLSALIEQANNLSKKNNIHNLKSLKANIFPQN